MNISHAPTNSDEPVVHLASVEWQWGPVDGGGNLVDRFAAESCPPSNTTAVELVATESVPLIVSDAAARFESEMRIDSFDAVSLLKSSHKVNAAGAGSGPSSASWISRIFSLAAVCCRFCTVSGSQHAPT